MTTRDHNQSSSPKSKNKTNSGGTTLSPDGNFPVIRRHFRQPEIFSSADVCRPDGSRPANSGHKILLLN